MDSFSMVAPKRFLEKRHGIQFPDADASPQASGTVNSIMALVERFQKK